MPQKGYTLRISVTECTNTLIRNARFSQFSNLINQALLLCFAVQNAFTCRHITTRSVIFSGVNTIILCECFFSRFI